MTYPSGDDLKRDGGLTWLWRLVALYGLVNRYPRTAAALAVAAVLVLAWLL